MEARGYIGGAVRSAFVVLVARPLDWAVLAFALAFALVCAGLILFAPRPAVVKLVAWLGF